MSERKKYLRNIVLLLLVVLVTIIVYLTTGEMTIRQKIMKLAYPLVMWGAGKKAEKLHKSAAKPSVDFYTLSATPISGGDFSFQQLRGKKVLLVNTASNCGYTGQYEALQKLSDTYAGKLMIIGFPANDFKEQERGTDEEIAQFCKRNYGVSFPMMKKTVVVKSAQQHPVYRWLTDAAQNGWNSQAPKWNFSKYLVNEEGMLTHYFDPGVSPLSKDVTEAIEK